MIITIPIWVPTLPWVVYMYAPGVGGVLLFLLGAGIYLFVLYLHWPWAVVGLVIAAAGGLGAY
ncbi:MAG: hypothetical protein ACK5MY_02695 [Jhaorihella sp.]